MSRAATTAPGRRRSSSACMARGCGARRSREISQWDEVADREGLIVVYPSGLGGSGPRAWRADAERCRRDVTFISDLIDKLKGIYNIDPARIYANGLSNGGGMSFALSCTLSDRIAAVGLVGAAHLVPFSSCPDPRPVPSDRISWHRRSVYLLSRRQIVGGPASVSRHPDLDGELGATKPVWPDPVESAVAADVTRLDIHGLRDRADVVLYTIRDGGHTWPGGGPVPEWFLGPTTPASTPRE